MKGFVFHGPGQSSSGRAGPRRQGPRRCDRACRRRHDLEAACTSSRAMWPRCARHGPRPRGGRRRRGSGLRRVYRTARGPCPGLLHHRLRTLRVLPQGHAAGQCGGDGGWILGDLIDGTGPSRCGCRAATCPSTCPARWTPRTPSCSADLSHRLRGGRARRPHAPETPSPSWRRPGRTGGDRNRPAVSRPSGS